MENRHIAATEIAPWSGAESIENRLRETLSAAVAVSSRLMGQRESTREVLYVELIPLLAGAILDCLESADLRKFLISLAAERGLEVQKRTDPAIVVVRLVVGCERQRARLFVGCCYELILRQIAPNEIADTLRAEGGLQGLSAAFWRRRRKVKPEATRPKLRFERLAVEKLSRLEGIVSQRVFFSAIREDDTWVVKRVTRKVEKILE